MKVKIGPYSKNDKKRKIKIKIDNYDIWNADHTMAMIILPMLKRIIKLKQGSPFVSMKDVPERLRCEIDKNNYKDETIHKRWRYALKKMIVAFELIVSDDCNFDKERNKKINRGLKLFAKYYRGLWT